MSGKEPADTTATVKPVDVSDKSVLQGPPVEQKQDGIREVGNIFDVKNWPYLACDWPQG